MLRSQQETPALRAELNARPVRGLAARAAAEDAGALELDLPLHLGELGVDALELCGLAGKGVEANVIADRHLVEGPAEVHLQHREALQQAVSLRAELRVLVARLGRRADRRGPVRRRGRAVPGRRHRRWPRVVGGLQETEAAHGWPPGGGGA